MPTTAKQGEHLMTTNHF